MHEIESIIISPATGDSFNPVIIVAIGGVCLLAAFYLIFSGKRKK